MKLPNYENAFIAKEKILNYLLDEDNSKGKSVFFNLFGYFKDNFEDLAIDLIKLASSEEVSETEQTKFGLKFIISGNIIAPNGRSIVITSVWIIKNDENFPRLVTAYPA
ncbi:MAG: hypothetical protein U5N85_13475 [Arcicella sp.]|nr:hypothetical protein [Arcicella sp.]